MVKEQLIQDYLANRLSEEESAKVKRMLETDTDFKSEFEAFKDVQNAFKISEAKALKKQLQDLEPNIPNTNKGSKYYKKLFLAIASIVVVGLFYTLLQTPTADQLFESNFEVYPNTYQPVTRSNTNNNDAFVAYENKDFATAEKEFKSLLEIEQNSNIRFYYALSLLNQSKFDLALEQLKIVNTKTHDYKAESLWYTALIYIKKEEFSLAEGILKTLNNSDSKFKLEERKLLLQKITK